MRSDHLIKMHSLGIDDPVVNDARIPGAANGNTQCNNMSTISSTTALYLFLSVLYLGLFLYNALGHWHRRAWTMVTLHPQSQASDLIVENSLVTTTDVITEVQSAPAASLANVADIGDVVVKVDRQLLQEEVNDFREEWSSNWDADLSAALASTQYQQQYEQVDAAGAISVAEVGSTEWSELQADPTKISSESQAALDDEDNQIDDELVAESAAATQIESEIETGIETKADIKTDVQVAEQTAVPSEVPSDMPIVFDYTAKKKLGKVSSTVIASLDSQVQPPKTPQQTRPQSTTPAPVKKTDNPPKNSSSNSAIGSLWTPQKEKNPTLGINTNTNSNVNINGFLNAQQRVAVADTQTPIQVSIHLGDLDRDYPNQSFRLYDQFELNDWASNAAGTLLLSPDELPLGEQSFVIEKDHFFPVRITLNADASQAWGEGEYVVPMLSQLKVAQLYTDTATAENNQDQLDQGMLMVDLTGAKGMLGPYVNGQAPKAYLDQQLNQTDDLALAQYALFLGLRAGNHLLSFQQPATQDHSAAEQGQYREVSDILFVRPDQITFYAPKIVHQPEQFLNFATQTIYSQKQTALPLPYGAVREEVNDQPLKKLAPSEFLLSSRSKFQQSMALINVKVGDAFFTIDTTMVNASRKNERQTLLLPNLMQVETLLSDLDSDDLQGQCLLDLSFAQPIDGEIEALAEFADDLDGDANVRTDDLKVYYLGEEGVMTDYHTADAQKAYIIAPSTGSVHLKWIAADGTLKSKIFPCGNQIYMMSHLD